MALHRLGAVSTSLLTVVAAFLLSTSVAEKEDPVPKQSAPAIIPNQPRSFGIFSLPTFRKETEGARGFLKDQFEERVRKPISGLFGSFVPKLPINVDFSLSIGGPGKGKGNPELPPQPKPEVPGGQIKEPEGWEKINDGRRPMKTTEAPWLWTTEPIENIIQPRVRRPISKRSVESEIIRVPLKFLGNGKPVSVRVMGNEKRENSVS